MGPEAAGALPPPPAAAAAAPIFADETGMDCCDAASSPVLVLSSISIAATRFLIEVDNVDVEISPTRRGFFRADFCSRIDRNASIINGTDSAVVDSAALAAAAAPLDT